MSCTPSSGTHSRPVTSNFEWINAIVNSTCLSTKARHLALTLATFMNADGSIPHKYAPTTEKIAERMGYAPGGRKNLTEPTKELEASGYLVVTGPVVPAPGRLRYYEARLPSGPVTALGEAPASSNPPIPYGIGDAEPTDPVPDQTPPPNRSRTGPYPNQKHQHREIPNPSSAPNATAATEQPTEAGIGISEEKMVDDAQAVRLICDRVYGGLLARGYQDDAARFLTETGPNMRAKGAFTERVGRLVRDGWVEELVAELLAKHVDYSPSPYYGAKTMSGAVAGRVKAFAERHAMRKKAALMDDVISQLAGLSQLVD